MLSVSRALISVYDKTGIVDFARNLADSGVELISTGGTARTLREAGIAVTDVSDVTGFPEIMEGRVKTLHPMIHGGLLGRLDSDLHLEAMRAHGISSIDLLVSNLYPFEKTLGTPGATHDEIIEQIDVGGPAMIRAGAKNYRFTAVVTSPARYGDITEELRSNGLKISEATCLRLAYEAFAHTANYDAAIARYLGSDDEVLTVEPVVAETPRPDGRAAEQFRLDLPHAGSLRYGENPHQSAGLYGSFPEIFEQIHGKELSYNNILDIDAAGKLVLEFDEPTVAIIKHNNPCGVGTAERTVDAWRKAFATDTKSAFGGIVAVNREIDAETAAAINEIFTEVVIAPSFSAEALELLRKKKDRRLIRADYARLRDSLKEDVVRSVAGGVLVQGNDNALVDHDALRVATKREPTAEEKAAMEYAWRVAKHVKSNAIVYALHDRTLGIGAGQMSRVDSAIIAAHKAAQAGLSLTGCAVASDAFFPFADGLLEAIQAGATSVIQPGGSIRDEEVIAAADEHDIAMVLTGMRHFRH
jgi:phosphoribosylaminoimidazolecarboxamide formyltransferase/IMP cyclohydrolase